jgi:hypothetical protein
VTSCPPEIEEFHETFRILEVASPAGVCIAQGLRRGENSPPPNEIRDLLVVGKGVCLRTCWGKIAACLRDWLDRWGDCAACDLLPPAAIPRI